MSGRGSTNPFCTRFFQPGAIPFFFEPPMTLDRLVHDIIHHPTPRAAIVGPHGTGKSTLLQHVLRHPAFHRTDKVMHTIQFHAGSTSWSRWRQAMPLLTRSWPKGQIYFVIDGWEQMDLLLQWTVRQIASVRDGRILATSHMRPRCFTEIWRTRVDASVEEHVLTHMVPRGAEIRCEEVMSSQEWKLSRNRHGQNLRESLFDMYDWYRDQVDVAKPRH